MKIVTIVGARPQFIKAATVSRVVEELPDVREVLVHTGQHYDENMSDIFFRELEIPKPHYHLGVGSASHAVQTGEMLRGIEEVLLKEQPDWVLVYGDTNSTLAGALAAVKLHIRVAHVEAGLRSFNRAMPEEINRIATDHVADLLLAPTLTAVKQLAREGLESITQFTGDVMYDSVLFYRDRVLSGSVAATLPVLPAGFLLATVHRAENTDNPANLAGILEGFALTGRQIVMPVHPRTARVIGNLPIPANLHLINPVGYLQMLDLTLRAEKVLTDSGGLQKEAYFLGKPCITLRTETEWVETLENQWNIIAGCDPASIAGAVGNPLPSSPPEPAFGDGHAARAVLDRMVHF